MRKLTGALAAALVILSACSTSNVNPNASISITGSFARQDGTPASGASVSLMREADVGEGLAAFSTIGLVCLGDKRTLATCSHGTNSTLDSHGNFKFNLKGSDTQGFFGNAATLELTSVLPRTGSEYDGSATTVRFQVQTDALAFPLGFWQPSVNARIDAGEVRVSWSQLPTTVLPQSVPMSDLTFDVAFDKPQSSRVWTQSGQAQSATLDPRVLEDSTGTVSVLGHAKAVRVPDSFGRAIDIILRSARYAYQGPAGAPPSRGAACAIQSSDGHLAYQQPCALTNGTFDRPWTPTTAPSAPQGGETAAVIDLGNSKPISFVVARGCSSGCTVSISDDAHTWRQVVNAVPVDDVAATIQGAPTARYVRVESQSIASLRQVSVWDSPASLPPRSILGVTSTGLPLGARGSTHAGRTGILIALGAALLALGLLARLALKKKRTA